jgi:hypothetical protein
MCDTTAQLKIGSATTTFSVFLLASLCPVHGGRSSGEITRQKSHLKLSDSEISPVASENPDGYTFRGGIFMKAISNNFFVFSVLYLKVQAACLPWQGVASQSRPMKVHNSEYNPKISTSHRICLLFQWNFIIVGDTGSMVISFEELFG